jgi:excisionase family DNA binding protein
MAVGPTRSESFRDRSQSSSPGPPLGGRERLGGTSRVVPGPEGLADSDGTNRDNGVAPGNTRLLSLQQAAAELGVSIWTVRDWVGAGKLRAVQPPGFRRIFIDRRDLDAAIEAWKA